MVPKAYKPPDLRIGMQDCFEIVASTELINSFIQLSGDANPLHTDNEYAAKAGFKGRIAHGALQQAFISRMAGMYLPGRFCFLKKLTTTYLSPVFEGERLAVTGELIRLDSHNGSGQIKVTISAVTGNEVKSISAVEFGLLGCGNITSPVIRASDNDPEAADNRGNKVSDPGPGVLLLGGNGGLGKVVASELTKRGLSCFSAGRSDACDLDVDFAGEQLQEIIRFCTVNHITAIVHLASLKPQKVPPSELDIENLLMSIRIHLAPLKVVACAIRKDQLPDLKDIICIGSTWARHRFPEKGFEGYAYAKTLFSLYAADIARDLASKGVRVNTISPSELSVGMHAGMAERMKAMYAARQPSGEMTRPEAVAMAIAELLESKVFITGQEIVMAGGRTW